MKTLHLAPSIADAATPLHPRAEGHEPPDQSVLPYPEPVGLSPESDDGPALLTPAEGVALVALLNELSARAWPLISIADHVYLHFHADGVWQMRVGCMAASDLDPWQSMAPTYPSLLEALRAAVQVYRNHPSF